METIGVNSSQHSQLIDITAEVQRAVAASGVRDGICLVATAHTTAAVTVNENADPAVVDDLLAGLEKVAPWRAPYYSHGEGNSAAHLKSSLVGCDQLVPVSGGRLVLGTWQGIYFCEFDGPRRRQVHVQVVGR